MAPVSVLLKMFSNTYKFCNDDINKFILLLRRGIYPLNTSIAGKDSMKQYFLIIDVDITDVGYRHAEKYIKNSK